MPVWSFSIDQSTSVYSLDSSVYKTTHEYNADDYATKETKYKSDGTTVEPVTEYTY